jgi:hypothetical protein
MSWTFCALDSHCKLRGQIICWNSQVLSGRMVNFQCPLRTTFLVIQLNGNEISESKLSSNLRYIGKEYIHITPYRGQNCIQDSHFLIINALISVLRLETQTSSWFVLCQSHSLFNAIRRSQALNYRSFAQSKMRDIFWVYWLFRRLTNDRESIEDDVGTCPAIVFWGSPLEFWIITSIWSIMERMWMAVHLMGIWKFD